jgi:predicted AAA+ superfamily ATPase
MLWCKQVNRPRERPLARGLPDRIADSSAPRRFQLVLGPRRVGKTTAMYQAARRLLNSGVPPERVWWLRMDHPLLLRESLGDLVRQVCDASGARAEQPSVLLLDELVYARDWDLWLKTFYDDQWPVQVIATSSATAALRDRRQESGVGRWSEQFLLPYLFTEYLDLVGNAVPCEVGETLAETVRGLPARLPEPQTLSARRYRFLLLGGFPELLAQELAGDGLDDADRTLLSQQILRSDAVERAIYKDIPQSFGIDNPMLLERLLYVLAGQIGGVISPTGIGRDLDGMSQPTLDRYVSYLEKTFMIFQLSNYGGSEAQIQRRGRELYFLDGAIRNAALQRGSRRCTTRSRRARCWRTWLPRPCTAWRCTAGSACTTGGTALSKSTSCSTIPLNRWHSRSRHPRDTRSSACGRWPSASPDSPDGATSSRPRRRYCTRTPHRRAWVASRLIIFC